VCTKKAVTKVENCTFWLSNLHNIVGDALKALTSAFLKFREPNYFLLPYSNTLHDNFSYPFLIPFKYYLN
jgi:hypothetical protein